MSHVLQQIRRHPHEDGDPSLTHTWIPAYAH